MAPAVVYGLVPGSKILACGRVCQ